MPLTEGGSMRTVKTKAQKGDGASMRLVDGSMKAKTGTFSFGELQ